MKLMIEQIIPVANHWNKYMNDDTQEEVYFPVSALALVQEVGDSESVWKYIWKYIDIMDIESQHNPNVFEDFTYMETVFSLSYPNKFLEINCCL